MDDNTKSLDTLSHSEWNPRTISKHDFEALKKSMREFGDLSGVVKNIETGTLVGGNQRLEAFKQLPNPKIIINHRNDDGPNVVGTVANGYIELDNGERFAYREVMWTLEREKAANIAANRIQGEFQLDMLAKLTYELKEFDPDLLDLTGQTNDEINSLLDSVGVGDGSAEEDEVPEVSDGPAASVLGEIYQLGDHRVMCGDSTDFGQVSDLMDGAEADMVFTDPPWNVDYGGTDRPSWKSRAGDRTIENDNLGEDFRPFMNSAMAAMTSVSKPGCPTYVVMSAQEWGLLMDVMKDNDYHWSSTIIWAKDRLVLSRKDYHTQYEPIWYGWKEGSRLTPLADRTQSDLWQIPRPSSSEEHPTMKPIALIQQALANSSKREDAVLDLFGGSGSTLMACDLLERKCYMMELDPKYCDVIRKRYAISKNKEAGWAEFTPAINKEVAV